MTVMSLCPTLHVGGFCGFVGPLCYVAWMVSFPITAHSSDTLCTTVGLLVWWSKAVFRVHLWMFDRCLQRIFVTQKSNMAMENPPFEDVFPIEHGDFAWLSKF